MTGGTRRFAASWSGIGCLFEHIFIAQVSSLIPGLHDWGHSYTIFAQERNHTQFLFPRLSDLHRASAGQFCGLSMSSPWVYHNFFGTRTRSENLPDAPVEIPFAALQVFFHEILENQPRSVGFYAWRVEQAAEAAKISATSTPTPEPTSALTYSSSSLAPASLLSVHLIVAHFRNLLWLPVCLQSHIQRLVFDAGPVFVSVVTMESNPDERLTVRELVAELSASLNFSIEVVDFPLPESVRGGSSLPAVLNFGLKNVSRGMITVFSDSDAYHASGSME